MDTTFISIHDLTKDAVILYSSDSVVDVLGYTPDEIVNRSAWDFFAQEDLPYARDFHLHQVALDKAAVLAYVRVLDRNGSWVGCECCFTIVYDVMVVCTSVYQRGLKSEQRAVEAPMIRRIFSASPKDPRYHMLSHISSKFADPYSDGDHEPRAALFLNRFTRSLTVMYATSGLQDVIGVPAETMRGRSFYYCIAENCLPEAVKCLENAKGNDSIAYLRFWFRDPRLGDNSPTSDGSDADEGNDADDYDESEDDDNVSRNPVDEDSEMTTGDEDGTDNTRSSLRHSHADYIERSAADVMDLDSSDAPQSPPENFVPASRSSFLSPNTTRANPLSRSRPAADSPIDALPHSLSQPRPDSSQTAVPSLELEAVVSCASDGLVVCLRRARPLPPSVHRAPPPTYTNGFFAAPWAPEDPTAVPPTPDTSSLFATRQNSDSSSGRAPTVAAAAQPAQPAPLLNPSFSPAKPDPAPSFLTSIREQAIFAWALTGINGSLARFSRGVPRGESLPPDGFPIWVQDPSSKNNSNTDNKNNKYPPPFAPNLSSSSSLDDSKTRPPHPEGVNGISVPVAQHVFAPEIEALPAAIPTDEENAKRRRLTRDDSHLDAVDNELGAEDRTPTAKDRLNFLPPPIPPDDKHDRQHGHDHDRGQTEQGKNGAKAASREHGVS